jgi:hypothetical protein
VDRVEFSVDGVLAGVARKPPYRVAHDFGTSVEPHEITAKVFSNGFRDSESATIRSAAITAGESINVDLVEVPLRLRSSSAPNAKDLRLRENGAEQTIRDIKQERPAAHFAFIIDRSLSMGDGKLSAALRAVQTELKQLRAGDTASLVLFNHHVAKARTIRKGDDLLALQNDVVPSGGTSLRDALASIASNERTYAIVITDGGDRNSELAEEEALRRISGTKTIASAIVLGGSHTKFLDHAAKNTGGAIVRATRDSVGRELAGVLADINSRYLLVYQSNATKRGWRSIDIQPKRRGISIVSARKGYFAE